MSFEETTDSTDLCEYDEYYDSYNVKTYQATSSLSFTEYGVPLSVELSESLGENQTLVNKQTYNCFVKSPEIFLRFDSNNVTTATDSICGSSSQNNNIDKSKNTEETILIESKENNDVIIRDDCVELQYANEFENPNDGEVIDGNAQKIPKRSDSLDNDYEELLIEGII